MDRAREKTELNTENILNVSGMSSQTDKKYVNVERTAGNMKCVSDEGKKREIP